MIGNDGMVALCGALGALSCLEVLILFDNRIGDEGMQGLAELLPAGALPKLERFQLQGNAFGAAGVAALQTCVLDHLCMPRLASLNLQHNSIGAQGGVFLGNIGAVGGLRGVSSLFLSSCKVGADGIAAMAKAVASMPRLNVLDISANELGDDGFEQLVDGLAAAGIVLFFLHVQNNGIGDRGALALLSYLEGDCGARLTGLHINANKLTNTSMTKISLALKAGAMPNIDVLNVDHNDATEAERNQVRNAVESRPAEQRAKAKALMASLQLEFCPVVEVLVDQMPTQPGPHNVLSPNLVLTQGFEAALDLMPYGTSGDYAGIVQFSASKEVNPHDWWWPPTPGDRAPLLCMIPNTTQMHVCCRTEGHLTEDRFTDVQTPLEMHEWSTVKLSKQHGSSVMEIFVNGIKVGENIWPLEDITCPSRVYLGGCPQASGAKVHVRNLTFRRLAAPAI